MWPLSCSLSMKNFMLLFLQNNECSRALWNHLRCAVSNLTLKQTLILIQPSQYGAVNCRWALTSGVHCLSFCALKCCGIWEAGLTLFPFFYLRLFPLSMRGLISGLPSDTKIHGCSSSFYKVMQYSLPFITTSSTSSDKEGQLYLEVIILFKKFLFINFFGGGN